MLGGFGKAVCLYGVIDSTIPVYSLALKALKAIQLNLRRLRALRGWTQVQTAEKAKVDYKHYQKIETGIWIGLQLTTVENLATAFGVEAWELLTPPATAKNSVPAPTRINSSQSDIKTKKT